MDLSELSDIFLRRVRYLAPSNRPAGPDNPFPPSSRQSYRSHRGSFPLSQCNLTWRENGIFSPLTFGVLVDDKLCQKYPISQNNFPHTCYPTNQKPNPPETCIYGSFRAIRYLSRASSISWAGAIDLRHQISHFLHYPDSLIAHTEALFPLSMESHVEGKWDLFPTYMSASLSSRVLFCCRLIDGGEKIGENTLAN
ncbi:hypothetical protein CEXT_560421 [Caerostris extrusa]|uniref:Uncharacterized protein n=1 Tax=Caerostris extrusa TaxID=172846 RepID=A0AAV4ML26_CAEEX|nr:hypothetical protein CEXT_560421 [Caerostris extrusa]